MAKILVPVDGTGESRAALPVAQWLARGLGAEIVLVTVGPVPETTEQAIDAQANMKQRLDWTAPELSGVPVRERTEVNNDRAEGIINAARDEHVDLIVMATQGKSPLAELTGDNIAEDVVRSGVAPVTLVLAKEDQG
jgi:nucleotide-binding universal stress UspA family protein